MSDTVVIDGDASVELYVDGDADLDTAIDGDGNTAIVFGRGTNDHRLLQYRDAEEQHPIGSITNLQQELSVRPSSPLTNNDIQNILNM